MVLTGTFSQYKALVPSIENGYFSRLLTLIVDEHQAFNSQYVEPSENSGDVIKAAAEQLYHLYEKLLFSKPREFRLTPDQRTRLGHHLETAYPTLIRMLGEDFHSVVLRMAVHIERIALILSALRSPSISSELDSDTSSLSGARGVRPENIVCADEDYATAELIGNKLILHMAQAYQLVKGTEKIEAPKVRPLDQKQILLSLLPEEFESKTLVDEAQLQGISRRTAFNWSEEWHYPDGRVFGCGPKEVYAYEPRDYKRDPRTPAEQAQYERWKAVCQEASRIAKDPNHPRYREMVERHAAQLRGKPDPVLGKKRICQFGNFVRAVLIHE